MEGEFSFSNSGNEFPPISCCLNKFLCIVNFILLPFPSLAPSVSITSERKRAKKSRNKACSVLYVKDIHVCHK